MIRMRKRDTLLAGVASVILVLPSAAHAAPGDAWRPVAFLPIERINDFEAVGPAEVWNVGTDYDISRGAVPAIFKWSGGLSWERYFPSQIPDSGRLTDVTARSADDVWIAGYLPSSNLGGVGFTYVARYDGRSWGRMASPHPAIETGYRELASDSAGVWLTEGWRVSRWDGTSWTVSATLNNYIERIEAFGPDNAWAQAGEEVWHWDGSSWQQVPRPAGVYGSMVRFTAGGAWAAAPSGLQTWDGSSWQQTPYPEPFDGEAFSYVTGLADSDGQWVNLRIRDGERGLLRWDGSAWTSHPLMTGVPHQVVVDGAGRIWGVNRISRLVSTLPTGGYNQYKGQIVRLKNGAWENVGVSEADYRLVHLPGGDGLYGAGENEWTGADRVVTNR